MTTLKFADTHNVVAFLSKPTESKGFEQIMDFLNAHPIKYALTVNPTIYILLASNSSGLLSRDLQLVDENGIDCLPNSTIFKQLALMGPIDPYHTPIITQPSTSQPQKTQKPRKPKRKDTQIPQSSNPMENVADEAVHNELGDRLVRAATIASSLEAEQDSGNITKTRSKATPNESSSQGADSGGGPRCQETIRDTIAQTRFENVSKLSNDSLLVRARVESSGDEESLGKDASKQGRINAIDEDDDITLVVHDDVLDGEEVVMKKILLKMLRKK
ncbi:hypothetical protein Tco_0004915 [Tanacetum coccineum]